VSNLWLWGRGWQVAGCDRVIETISVGTVAEGFVLRHAASAEPYDLTAAESEGFAFRVHNFEVAFNPDRTIVIDRDLCVWHEFTMLARRYFLVSGTVSP
jgi:hypothetical protein